MSSTVKRITKLSHKAFRALLKKFRRKKLRQKAAIERDKQEQLEREKHGALPYFKETEDEKRRNAALWEEFQERESRRKHKEWLLREELAQAEFQRKKKVQEIETEKRETERLKMLAELEEKQLLEASATEKEQKAKEKKEEALQEALSGLPQANEQWQNPPAPENYNAGVQKETCSFFIKTGCCRFGDRCSRSHAYPEISSTILIKGMYSHFSIDQGNRDDYDTDMALEFEEKETYQDFEKFYHDVLPEFKTCGRVVQFKVCCNHEPHLRGNVYVQYSRDEYAIEAFKKFNGRFYAGKQISCEFTHVTNWKSAICGTFSSKRCPKGNQCNFLHVFRNPNNEFRPADRNWTYSNSERSHRDHSSRRSSSRYSYRGKSPSYRDRSPPSYRSSRSSRRSPVSKRRHSSDSSSSEDDKYSSHGRNNGQSKDSSRERHRRSISRSSSSSSDEKRKHKKKSKKKKKKRKKEKRTDD